MRRATIRGPLISDQKERARIEAGPQSNSRQQKQHVCGCVMCETHT